MTDKIDKVYDLLEKVYIDLQETKKQAGANSGHIQSVSKELQSLNNNMIRFENESNKKFDALFDGYKQVYEKLEEHDRRFDFIEQKLEKQDVEICVINGGKD